MPRPWPRGFEDDQGAGDAAEEGGGGDQQQGDAPLLDQLAVVLDVVGHVHARLKGDHARRGTPQGEDQADHGGEQGAPARLVVRLPDGVDENAGCAPGKRRADGILDVGDEAVGQVQEPDDPHRGDEGRKDGQEPVEAHSRGDERATVGLELADGPLEALLPVGRVELGRRRGRPVGGGLRGDGPVGHLQSTPARDGIRGASPTPGTVPETARPTRGRATPSPTLAAHGTGWGRGPTSGRRAG